MQTSNVFTLKVGSIPITPTGRLDETVTKLISINEKSMAQLLMVVFKVYRYQHLYGTTITIRSVSRLHIVSFNEKTSYNNIVEDKFIQFSSFDYISQKKTILKYVRTYFPPSLRQNIKYKTLLQYEK